MPIDVRVLDACLHRDRAAYDATVARLQEETITRVNQDMCGRDAHQVYGLLVDRLQNRLPGSQMDFLNLRTIAAAISDRTFRSRPGHLA